MDSDQGKLFIGGISWDTSEDGLKHYFSKYGEVTQAVIMKDKLTARPRGFGFVVFADPSILDLVLEDKHVIDGRNVEAKRALSRDEQHTSARSSNNSGRGMGGGSGDNTRTKKIFVGGLPPTLSEDGFRQYFENYGMVTDVVVMYDQSTQRPRGFGFISFDTEDAVDRVLHKSFHDLNGKLVEVKKALPKDANPSNGASGGRSMGNGSYNSYGSNHNANSYDGGMDNNRYVQPPAPGGYPGYGPSGYGAQAYGYGAAAGYGGYGMGGFGGAAVAGYGPPGAYGNPNASAGGYGGGPRNPYNNQAAGGYASAAYGGGNPAASTGLSPGGAAYGNPGYGYGGYGGSDGSYSSQGGYGAAGRAGNGGPTGASAGGGGDQRAGSGYFGGGYGDANGNSGYPNSWTSAPSQAGAGYSAGQVDGAGGPGSYGGGYDAAQARQTAQQ